jgi:type I restriction enzyme, S subunit
MPKDWKETKLGNLGEVNRGRSRHRPRYAPHLYGGPYPFIQTGDIKESNGKITSYKQTYNEAGLSQSRLWPAGTMCITIAANIAETAILTFPACFPDSVIGFIPDERKCDIHFIEYTFRFLKRQIQSQASGSVQDNINLETLDNLIFLIPHISEQKAITGILSSLDDKIELLRRQNKTLENIARAIFKQWFVAEAESKWEPVKIGDYVKTNTLSVDNGYFFNSIQYLDTGSIIEGEIDGIQLLKIKEAPSRAKRIVKHNDIVYSTVRPDQKHFGILKYPPENMIASTGFCVLTCDKINPHFIYLLLTTEEMIDYLHLIAEGATSTYPSLKPSDIENIEFRLPPKDKMLAFCKYTETAWGKIHNNHTQIQTLSGLRDTLLPKLMKGEIRVKAADKSARDIS